MFTIFVIFETKNLNLRVKIAKTNSKMIIAGLLVKIASFFTVLLLILPSKLDSFLYKKKK